MYQGTSPLLTLLVALAGAPLPPAGPSYGDPVRLAEDSGGTAYGASVAGIGDLDGDGFDELVVGSPSLQDGSGTAFVYRGSADGLVTTASATLTGEHDEDLFASAVAGAGDVDGDGYDDLVIGSQSSVYLWGAACVYHGSASGLSSTATTTLSDGDGWNFGVAVAGAGDVNGDGYDDLVVGSPLDGYDWDYEAWAGNAFVYLGSELGLSSAPATTLVGEGAWSLGSEVSGAGDIDGDGYDDLVLGTSGYGYHIGTFTHTGAAYVYGGSPDGISASPDLTLIGHADGSYFGEDVSGAGDLDGDGYDDVLIGASDAYEGTRRGAVYVHAGSAGGLAEEATAVLLSEEEEQDFFGVAVDTVGDTNGDGFDDVLVGASMGEERDGAAYLFLGAASGVSTLPAARWVGEGEFSFFGATVSRAGDVDGNGDADLLVGASWHDARGRAYVCLSNGDPGGDSAAGSDSETGGAGSERGDSADPVEKSPSGCGCATRSPGLGAGVLALAPLLLVRRRRRWPTDRLGPSRTRA